MLQQKTDVYTAHRPAAALVSMDVLNQRQRRMEEWAERIPDQASARNSIKAMVCDTAREVFLNVNEKEELVDDYRKILAKQGDIDLLAWLEGERRALKERVR